MADCFEDEALADSPDMLWLFRDGTGGRVTDLSGNGHDGVFEYVESLDHEHSYNTSTSSTSITITRVTDFGDGSLLTLGFEIVNNGGSARTISLPAGWTTEATFLDASNNRYVLVSHVAASGETSYTFTFSATGTTRVLGRANEPALSVAEVAVVDGSGNITLPGLPGWRRVLKWSAGSLNSIYSDTGSFPSNATRSFRHSFGIYNSADAGDSLTGKTPGDMVIQLAHSDPQELGWSSETGICDPDCADVNGSVSFATWAQPRGTSTITVDNSGTPFGGWFEYLIRLHAPVSGTVTTLMGYESDGTTWTLGGDPVAGGDTCWIYGSGSGSIDSTTELFGSSDGFDESFGELCMFAVYPSELSSARKAAHRAHFCDLCRRGRGLVLGSLTLN